MATGTIFPGMNSMLNWRSLKNTATKINYIWKRIRDFPRRTLTCDHTIYGICLFLRHYTICASKCRNPITKSLLDFTYSYQTGPSCSVKPADSPEVHTNTVTGKQCTNWKVHTATSHICAIKKWEYQCYQHLSKLSGQIDRKTLPMLIRVKLCCNLKS